MEGIIQMITGAADPRSLDGQLRSREEALRQVTRDEAAVVLACERLDHARHALGLLHVLAARLAALEADRTDAAVAREARRCACLLYTSPSPRDGLLSRMPSSA